MATTVSSAMTREGPTNPTVKEIALLPLKANNLGTILAITLNEAINKPVALEMVALTLILAQPDDKLRNATLTRKLANNPLNPTATNAFLIGILMGDRRARTHKETAPTNHEGDETLIRNRIHPILANPDRNKLRVEEGVMTTTLNNLATDKDDNKTPSNVNNEDNKAETLNSTILALRTAVAPMDTPLDIKATREMTMEAAKPTETATKAHGKAIIVEMETSASLRTLHHGLPTNETHNDLHLSLTAEVAIGNLEAIDKATHSVTPPVETISRTVALRAPTAPPMVRTIAMATTNASPTHRTLNLTTLPTLVALAINPATRSPNKEMLTLSRKP